MVDPLEALRAAQRNVEEADQSRTEAMRLRDEAVRAAHAAGVTWAAMRAETGMSPDTIRKAIRRGDA